MIHYLADRGVLEGLEGGLTAVDKIGAIPRHKRERRSSNVTNYQTIDQIISVQDYSKQSERESEREREREREREKERKSKPINT